MSSHWFTLCFVCVIECAYAVERPHIVVIIADDLGWNDVGFHGLNNIQTPNIDALAYSGLMLHNFYVTPICTPSRSALMTGKYPIHNGMQHRVIYGTEPRGLPLSEKILPQYLKELGYKTHLVGKWHLGSYKKEYLPLYRGFDSHLGFWTGRIDMYDHTSMEAGSWGFDFRRNFEVADEYFGQYVTDIFTQESVKIIERHNRTDPLFLMIAHSAVHSGNPYEPIRAPDREVLKFANISYLPRRKFAGVLSKLDESVGKVVTALEIQGILKDTIILFMTDNGGPAAGFNDNAASNYPLRGVKNTLWEGGVRGTALLWSPLIERPSRVAVQRLHLVDILPTLYSAAGGNVGTFQNIDGIDFWQALSRDKPLNRKVILHNIDDILGSAAITVDDYKLHKGSNYNGVWDNWYGPSGSEGHYDVELVLHDRAGRAAKRLGLMPDRVTIWQLRQEALIKCSKSVQKVCDPFKAPCLFDIKNDPCELNNLADRSPLIVDELLETLSQINKTVVPPNNRELDGRGDPKLWGRVYTNFGDYNTKIDAELPVDVKKTNASAIQFQY